MRSREEEEGRAQINRKRGGEGRQEIGNICFFFFAPNSFSPRVAPDNADASSRGEREELILSRWRKIEGEAREGKGERWDGMGWDGMPLYLPERGRLAPAKKISLAPKSPLIPERERGERGNFSIEREREEKSGGREEAINGGGSVSHSPLSVSLALGVWREKVKMLRQRVKTCERFPRKPMWDD